MRRLLPTSMAGWLILLIVLGLGVSQAVTIAIHYDSRREASYCWRMCASPNASSR